MKLLSIIAAVLLPVSCPAATVLYYGFESDSSPETSPGITASDFTAGPQVTQIGLNSGAWSGGNWSEFTSSAGIVGSGHYAGFTATVDPNQSLNIQQISFDVKPDGAGPKNYLLTVSDSYGNTYVIGGDPIKHLNPAHPQTSTNLVSLGGHGGWETILAAPDLSSLTGNLEFRIYGFDAQRQDRDFSLDNVKISGNFAAVPEPSASLFFLLIGLVIANRRTR